MNTSRTCPRCAAPMAAEESCDSCLICGGTWFTIDQAERYFRIEVREQSTEGTDPAALVCHRSPGPSCPACSDALIHLETDGELTLDQCEKCSGLFFDAGESLSLKSKLALGVGGPAFRRVVEQIIMYRRGAYR